MPVTLFLYGTLRHMPLLETVLGRPVQHMDMSPGLLPDHSVHAVAEGPFPTILSTPGLDTSGLLVRDLSDEDMARIDYYEGGFDYTLQTQSVRSGEAVQVYFSPPGDWTAQELWHLEHWEDRWAPLSVAAAREVMSYFGTRDAAEVARHFPRIRARAQSAVNAAQGRHGTGTLDGRIEMIRRERVHLGFFALDRMSLSHSTFAGGMGAAIDREVFVTSDAAIVLPYDPLRDRVLLVEQVRMGPIGRGDPVCWQLEPVAGLIDPGESPQDAARREATEEAGIEIGRLEPVAEAYASPGSTSDFHYIYVGICDIPDGLGRRGGNPQEGEDIRIHLMDFADLLKMAEDQRTANTPLTLATYWLAHHRSRLRQMA